MRNDRGSLMKSLFPDTIVSRRRLLAAGTAGAAIVTAASTANAASFGNPDEPAEGAVNVTNPKALTDPGPQDPSLAGNEPAFLDPPATDVNGMPQFWASFNLAPKRIQNGGWARQITQDDFKISTTIAGVNMRLGPGGVRELHWHQQAEWAVMTYGHCRVTILDLDGRPSVADVKEGDLWYFPAGLPHSLQGLEPDGAEFVLAFDNGKSSEFNTLLVSDWLAHTPPEVLAKNFGVPVEAFKNIPVAQQVDLPKQNSGAAALGSRGQIGGGSRQAAESIRVQARGHAPEPGDKERHSADRRQYQLPCVEDHCRDTGHDQARRAACHALAS